MPISDTIAWAKPEDVGMSRERVQRISDVFSAEIEAGRLPGAVSIVSRRGRIVHFKAAGMRDPQDGAAMERDAIFRIYSMTKPVVSVALMRLVEEGRLTLADELATFIPAFRDVTVAHVANGEVERRPPARPVTVLDLMRHTSGLTYDWISDGPVQRLYGQAGVSARNLTNEGQAALLATLPLAEDPGTTWHYGRSTDMIGRIIEILSGQTLGAHLDAAIFRPLGMVDTRFLVPEEDHGRVAEPFATDPDTGDAVRLLDVKTPRAAESGGGGLVSTASDYARFLHALANGGTLDGTRLLGPATIRYMAADQLAPTVESNTDLLPPGYGFGLGFAVRRAVGLAPFPGGVGDVFWQGLAGTSFWIDPVNELYAVLMIQAPGRLTYYRDLFRNLVYAALDE